MTGRDADKADREAALWAAKYAKAETSADLLAIEFDRLRAVLAELPRRQQESETKKLTDVLVRRREALTNTASEVHK